MFRFTLRQVQYFVAVAEHGSFSAAATACHVSQAGMSLAVGELEKALGTQLVVRHKARGTILTSAGSRFLADARLLLRQADELQASTSESQDEISGPLAIGCYTTLAAFWVPPITAGFAAPNPKLELSIWEGSPDELQRRMLDGTLDAVLMHTRHAISGVATQTVKVVHPYVLLAADHRLAGRGEIVLSELADEDMVLLDIPSVRENQLPNLRSAGLDPRIAWRSTSFEAVRAMVARGLGYTVLIQRPPLDTSYEGLPLACVPIADDIERSDICFGYPSQQRLSRRLQALIGFCRDDGAVAGALGECPTPSTKSSPR